MNDAKATRRLFLAMLLAASAFMVEAADAQGRGNGASNGNGGGNGNGNGNSGGNGNGNAGGANSGETAGDGDDAGSEAGPAPAAGRKRSSPPPSLRLRHSNGFEEEIDGGRYEMRDNRGRQIVNRAVRYSDYARLRRLMR